MVRNMDVQGASRTLVTPFLCKSFASLGSVNCPWYVFGLHRFAVDWGMQQTFVTYVTAWLSSGVVVSGDIFVQEPLEQKIYEQSLVRNTQCKCRLSRVPLGAFLGGKPSAANHRMLDFVLLSEGRTEVDLRKASMG